MEAGKKWNLEKDKMLIKLVKVRPGLYNPQTSNDSNYQRRTWRDIEIILGQSGAQNRCIFLCSLYQKYFTKRRTKNGQIADKISKYYDIMTFLDQVIHSDKLQEPSILISSDDEISNENSRDTDTVEWEFKETELKQNNDNQEIEVSNEYVNTFTNNIPSIQENINKASTIQQENASSTLMNNISRKKEKECDVHPIDKFFSLMATTVKKFTVADQHFVKTKVFALVNQMEERYVSSPFL